MSSTIHINVQRVENKKFIMPGDKTFLCLVFSTIWHFFLCFWRLQLDRSSFFFVFCFSMAVIYLQYLQGFFYVFLLWKGNCVKTIKETFKGERKWYQKIETKWGRNKTQKTNHQAVDGISSSILPNKTRKGYECGVGTKYSKKDAKSSLVGKGSGIDGVEMIAVPGETGRIILRGLGRDVEAEAEEPRRFLPRLVTWPNWRCSSIVGRTLTSFSVGRSCLRVRRDNFQVSRWRWDGWLWA